MSAEDIDKMDSHDINKLYMRYEARLGASMTNIFGQAVIQMYSTVVGQFLPMQHKVNLS